MKPLKLVLSLSAIALVAGCAPNGKADAEACDVFVPVFNELTSTLLSDPSAESTAELMKYVGEVKANLDYSIEQAKLAQEMDVSEDFEAHLKQYITDAEAASTAAANVSAGTVDQSFPIFLGRVGDSGDWLVNHCRE